jgi:hypothetical protein
MDDSRIQQPISDDQELAKVLAGVSQQTEEVAPVATTIPPATDDVGAVVAADPITPAASGPALDGIKLEALKELRPLVEKLNVPPEEKFDTYLLLLRSTDDRELVAPAHEAAKQIVDETRRAQALLDIIKEIDFLTQNKPA